MVEQITKLVPYVVLISHFIFVFLVLAVVFQNSWGKEIVLWLGKNALILGFLMALAAVTGSLFYSEIVGFEPCVLCWWQRVFIFPSAIIFGIALWKRNYSAFTYVVPLVSLAAIVAIYQSYVYLGGSSILPCTAVGGACSKVYVMAFGYITIPLMSLTVSLYVLLLYWTKKIYDKNSHA